MSLYKTGVQNVAKSESSVNIYDRNYNSMKVETCNTSTVNCSNCGFARRCLGACSEAHLNQWKASHRFQWVFVSGFKCDL